MVHLDQGRLITGFILVTIGTVLTPVIVSTVINANLTGTLLIVVSIVPVFFALGCLLVVTNLLNRS